MKKICIQDTTFYLLVINLNIHDIASAFIYVLLCIEHEEKSIVEEEVVPLTENPLVENNFYFDICGEEAATPTTQGKPGREGEGTLTITGQCSSAHHILALSRKQHNK
jgi:hypothetical protein